MLQNFSTKQKLFLNMVLAQTGLVSVGLVGYLGYELFCIALVFIFSLSIALSNYIVMDQITKGLAIFDTLFEQFVDFVLMKRNKVDKAQYYAKDELGVIITKVNNAIDTLGQNIQNDMRLMGEIVLTTDKAEQGIFTCRVKSDTQNPMLDTLKINLNKMLDELEKTISDISKVSNAYTNDDYTSKATLNDSVRADLKVLIQSVNKLGDSLAQSAKQNLDNGQNLESNAQTMTSNVDNLASKANQQAASLEETAAAVEEITSITRNTAENASKMSQVGDEVRTEVTKGMKLASNTSTSMDEINTEVIAINESINVIDQISFQTNILSLNAAVEAATAGESGKGFAVVAGEVRNLANRSSEAASEIKELVEHATTKAKNGKSISDDMIQGYKQLNARFEETAVLIEDVSSASKEQMTGIEQINDAVTMLDRVTQENANDASQVASIAADVSSMANKLVADAKTKKF